jgi:hypothetical protein
LFAVPFTGNAQYSSKLFFEHLTTEDGLAHNYILSITQDADGLIWLGSDNGLNCYDGQEITVFSMNTGRETLGGNKIRKVLQDKNRNLWILHENGLDRMDYDTRHIRHFLYGRELKKHLGGIDTDHSNRLIAYAENGIVLYDSLSETLAFRQIAPEDYSFSSFAKSSDRYYLGTRKHGIAVYDKGWNRIGCIVPKSKEKGILENGIIGLLRTDSDGNLWSVIVGICIQRYNTRTGELRTYPLSANSTIHREVRDLIELDANYMLVGTFNGLFRLNKHTFQVVLEKNELNSEGALSHYSVYSLYKDNQGVIWVGTYAGGVNYSHRYNRRFQYFTVPHFSGRISMAKEDKKGNIWLATEGNGLICHNPVTDEIRQFWLEKKKRYTDNIIKSIYIEGDTIMCGNWRGEVYLYLISENRFTLYKKYPSNNILVLYKDSRQHWWASVQGYGVIRMDEDTVRFPCANSIAEIEPGLLALGTQSDGLYIHDLETEKNRIFSLEDYSVSANSPVGITSAYKDSKGYLWFTTTNAGVWVLDEDCRLKHRFLVPEQGYSDKLYYVAEKEQDWFWIVGTHKLYLLDYGRQTLHSFDKNNGLKLTDMDASACVDSSGCLWIPGNMGYVKVENTSFLLNEQSASVVLTTLRINNQIQYPGTKESVLDKCLSETKTLYLKHNQTNISISYVCNNHIYANSNRFLYKMDGVDADWIDVGNRREIFYNNLAPGSYVLHIRAYNNDGMPGLETSLNITVIPPLWARWWSFALYILLAWYLVRCYVAYKQRKQRLEHELYIKQMEKEKSEEFNKELQNTFIQIAHEFRTPLSLIINPLEDIKQKIIHIPGVGDDVKLIHRNTKRLLSLVNELMDLQKIESSSGDLKLSSFYFNDLIQEIYYSFRFEANLRGVALDYSLSQESIWVKMDKEGMEKVFSNLLSNALKFTPANGKIDLRVSTVEATDLEKPLVRIELEDTGIGMPAEDMSRIFKPFALSRKDLYGQVNGSGVGLTIVQAIVEKHGGSISVERVEPHGTRFVITLPWIHEPVFEEGAARTREAENETPDEQPAAMTVACISSTVLLVDDNMEILHYLEARLSERFKILVAQNGREALEILKREAVSLVVSDVMMPEIDGITLCTRIKESPVFCHIPVILLTAKSLSISMEEGFLAGADDYLIKPFKVSTLVIRIDNILNARKKMKEIYGRQLSLNSAGIVLESADQKFVERYEAIIKNHLSDSEFDVERLCKEIGMSRASLYRKVKSITQMSPAELIRKIRLECAAEMLRSSDLLLTEIACQTGFGSYNHFSDYFKSVYGVSPKMYREQSCSHSS